MKRIITLSLFVICINQVCFSQVWTQVNNAYPGVCCGGRGCGTFSIGGTCYFVGGGPYYYDTWAFDTLTDMWTQQQNYPNVVDGTYLGFSLNGLGYVTTGVGYGYGWDSTLWQFNPTATNQWTKLAHFPGQPRGYAVGFTIDGMIFAGSGIGNSKGSVGVPLNDFYEYNPATNTWTQIASYPGNGTQYNVSFTIGDKAYVGCGATVSSNGYTTLNTDSDFWEYDTTSKVWTRIAGFGGGVRAGVTVLSTCNKGYVGLGYSDVNQQDVFNDFWEYDPNSNTWTQMGNYGGVARFAANGFTIGKSFFVGLGVNASNGTQADLWELIRTFMPAFSADTAVCTGGSITFTDTSNYNPTNWQWNFPGGTPDTSTQQNPVITYNNVGSYNVTLTAWNACGDSGSSSFTNYVTVTQGPSVSVMPDSPSVCNGQSIVLTASGGSSYQWVGTTDNTDTLTVKPANDTTYELRVSVGLCTTDTFISVKENNAPPLYIQPSSTSICPGTGIVLTVPVSGSDYTWSPVLTLSSSTGDSVTAKPSTQTIYTVTGIDSLGCSVTASDTISLSSAPNKPTISTYQNDLVSSATQGNQWLRNDTVITGATNQTYTVTIGGYYQVIASNPANGCSTESDSSFATGINQLTVESGQVTVYPNPTDGEINVNISSSAMDVSDWNLQIIDVLGRTVYNKLSLNYSNAIDLSNLSDGVYFICVMNKTGKVVVPMVKQ